MHLSEYWCIPKGENGEFVACMEDVLDLYQQPYDPLKPVVCMDELCKELHADVRGPLAPRPGSLPGSTGRRLCFEITQGAVAQRQLPLRISL